MSRLLPRYIQLASLLLAGVLAFMAIWIPLSEPWLGVRFEVRDGAARIAAVPPGLTLPTAPAVAVEEPGNPASRVALTADSFIDTPGYFRRFTEYRRFFVEQTRLAALRAAPEVVLSLADGQRLRLPWEARDLATLNFAFWFQFVCGLLAFSVAASVFAYRPWDTPARMYFLLGIGCLLIGMTAAVMRARMLSIDGEIFRAVHVVNHVGIFLGMVGTLGFLGTYPRRLLSTRVIAGGATFYAFWLAVDIGQFVESIDLAFRVPLLGTALPGIALLVAQWRAAKSNLLDRAALKWILFSFGISMVLIFANGLRTVLGLGTLLPSGYNTALTLLIFIGMAVGIRRSALFNLDPWWVDAWIWLVGGLTVVVVDLLLVATLKIGEASALAASMLICGWLYFPARQAVLARAYGARKQLADVFPEIVELLLAGPVEGREFVGRWRALLTRLFEPQAVAPWTSHAVGGAVSVVDDGLRLGVPALAPNLAGSSLLLEYAGNGSRLFTQRDARLVQSIRDIVARGLSAQAQYAQGAQAERERIAHDLHDDIGARLLTLIHRARGPEDAYVARSAMQDLRTLLSSLDDRPRLLEDALGDWRAEAESRCEAAGLDLDWRQGEIGGEPMLSSRQRVNLEKLLREMLTNVIRHAQARRVVIEVTLRDALFTISVDDDGIGLPEDRWRQGRGTLGMERRARDIGATLRHGATDGGGCRIDVATQLGDSR